MAKSRREVMYDHKSKKPAANADEKPAEKPADSGPTPAKGGVSEKEPGNRAASPPSADAESSDMFKRHEADRRTMHGNHRAEHRAIESAGGSDVFHKKMAAHHRHRTETDQMHERHERELIDKLSSLEKSEGKEAA